MQKRTIVALGMVLAFLAFLVWQGESGIAGGIIEWLMEQLGGK